MKHPGISVVIPVYNEEKNISVLHNKVSDVLRKINKDYEIIFVDDGSTDSSFKILESLQKKSKNTKVIKFRSNFGQTA
ncbi:MAG TPA: glycosyltransferase, partial [Candidatus Woesearchaeota archaeon]|nr:glycosyltransferase [Candidatus Woesearchaeota archaeon]